MVTSVAVGIGCRSNTPGATIARLVRDALARLPGKPDQVRLYSVARRAQEPGLHEAAMALGYDLVFLPDLALAAAAARVVTQSARVRESFGVGSVAEAAALIGGGPNAAIVVARLAVDGATCAIAAEPAISEGAA
ncbi:MAG: cobalamin biosynthesis protein [Xanthobacteraceae bacterium]